MVDEHSKKMKKYFGKIFLFSISIAVFAMGFFMEAENSEAAINGVLRVSPVNPRYFTDDTGKAIYLTGSHTWNSLEDGGFFTQENADPPPAFNFNAYLEFLRSNNHNFIRLWRFELPKFYYWLDIDVTSLRGPNSRMGFQFSQPHPWVRTGSGIALDGKPKFDLTKFDEMYFQRLKDRVAAAQARGIYVSVMLFEGGELRGSETWDWQSHPFKFANNVNFIEADANVDGCGVEVHSLLNPAITEIQKAYIRKVVDTVNHLDNVLYEVGNEMYFSEDNKDWQYWAVNYIKEYEATKPKQHPVGMVSQMYYPWEPSVPSDPRNAVLFNSPADWISPSGSGGSGYLNPETIPATQGSKVILFDTDHIWGIGGDRLWVWKSFLRGHNIINMDTLPEITEHVLYYAKAPEIRAAMGHTLTYANKVNLISMLPSNNAADCSTTYCLRNPGQEYLVYQPSAGAFTVNLPVGTFNYEWFNPATGSIAGTGTIIQGAAGNKSFNPPFSGDAVLYLKKTTPVDATPPAAPTGLRVQ